MLSPSSLRTLKYHFILKAPLSHLDGSAMLEMGRRLDMKLPLDRHCVISSSNKNIRFVETFADFSCCRLIGKLPLYVPCSVRYYIIGVKYGHTLHILFAMWCT